MRRREMLRLALLVAGAGIGLLARRSWARRGRTPDSLRLSPRDARLADLGERFTMENPATAHHLVEEVAAWRRQVAPGSAADTRRLRAALLGRRARERDLARDDVLSLDGWMLTRSEVACCVHLAAVRRDSRGGGGRAKLR